MHYNFRVVEQHRLVTLVKALVIASNLFALGGCHRDSMDMESGQVSLSQQTQQDKKQEFRSVVNYQATYQYAVQEAKEILGQLDIVIDSVQHLLYLREDAPIATTSSWKMWAMPLFMLIFPSMFHSLLYNGLDKLSNDIQRTSGRIFPLDYFLSTLVDSKFVRFFIVGYTYQTSMSGLSNLISGVLSKEKRMKDSYTLLFLWEQAIRAIKEKHEFVARMRNHQKISDKKHVELLPLKDCLSLAKELLPYAQQLEIVLKELSQLVMHINAETHLSRHNSSGDQGHNLNFQLVLEVALDHAKKLRERCADFDHKVLMYQWNGQGSKAGK